MKEIMKMQKNYLKMSNITQKRVDILISFANEYSKKISGSELARKLKIPQQTLSRLLNYFVDLNIINYERIGRNKLFYLDLGGQLFNPLINMLENMKALQFFIENKEEAIIINELLKNSESIVLFGSYTGNQAKKDSDIDVIILGNYNKQNIKKIKDRYLREINEHYISYNEFSKILSLKNALSIEILKNHIIFGNVSNVVDIFKEYENGKK